MLVCMNAKLNWNTNKIYIYADKTDDDDEKRESKFTITHTHTQLDTAHSTYDIYLGTNYCNVFFSLFLPSFYFSIRISEYIYM